MDILKEASSFEKEKMNNMSSSDRVVASRKAKEFILSINKIYKESKDPYLMNLMKRLTIKKKKIEGRLKMRREFI
ncbi:hypothetical protein [Ulvibacter antarcticus]|uniref:Uncharacterized protein n=1 Tax=Ulvibacter antarcticus TaxID=442714 RepID=A0A3L9YHQ2_9FLAO|nr:hypothetical protein [Ulvibacter antarcticus]RMA58729.1 hypothetical protein BXY75_2106 [Ulvibacter antarcticus]